MRRGVPRSRRIEPLSSRSGGVAERLKAPVLKTGRGQPLVSSSLTASATYDCLAGAAQCKAVMITC